jgi:hypothetical protein
MISIQRANPLLSNEMTTPQLKQFLRRTLPPRRPRKLDARDVVLFFLASAVGTVNLVPWPFLWLLNAIDGSKYLSILALLQYFLLFQGFAFYNLINALLVPWPDRVHQFTSELGRFRSHGPSYNYLDVAYAVNGWMSLMILWTVLRVFKMAILEALWDFCTDGPNRTEKEE